MKVRKETLVKSLVGRWLKLTCTILLLLPLGYKLLPLLMKRLFPVEYDGWIKGTASLHVATASQWTIQITTEFLDNVLLPRYPIYKWDAYPRIIRKYARMADKPEMTNRMITWVYNLNGLTIDPVDGYDPTKGGVTCGKYNYPKYFFYKWVDDVSLYYDNIASGVVGTIATTRPCFSALSLMYSHRSITKSVYDELIETAVSIDDRWLSMMKDNMAAADVSEGYVAGVFNVLEHRTQLFEKHYLI